MDREQIKEELGIIDEEVSLDDLAEPEEVIIDGNGI